MFYLRSPRLVRLGAPLNLMTTGAMVAERIQMPKGEVGLNVREESTDQDVP